MDTKLLIICFFTNLVLLGCHSSEKDLFEFDPEVLTDNNITLNEIADEIMYVPLDTLIKIGSLYSYRLIDDFIYLSVKDVGILLYTRSGKFIKKIGNPGRGPEEYNQFMYFDVDPKSRHLYVIDRNIIKIYDSEGVYKNSVSINDHGLIFLNDINYFNDKLIISDFNHYGISEYNWIALDTNGFLIKKKENYIPPFKSTLPSNGGNYVFNNNLHYWNLYCDTIFSIRPDLSYTASFIIKNGKFRWPKSNIKVSPTESFRSYLFNHLNINLILETKQFIILRYTYKNIMIVLLDKISKKSYITYLYNHEGSVELYGGILNDIDGGVPFKPEMYLYEKEYEYLVELIDPYTIKKHIKSIDFKNSSPKYPEKKEDLEKLANRLKETDNPVLMIIRLKE
ncbi:MAG: 6-bladed beta-propeller [Bacteroidales bacterium]|nr:6-bladed beta-propeller [Bacteroidales bacterium]